MGIQVEFNPDLALRNIEHYLNGRRRKEECIPLDLKVGETYEFLKEGQRNYWFEGELPLLETEGNQKLSRPIASIIIKEATHFVKGNQIYTKGKYLVKSVFNLKDKKINFESYKRL